MQTSNKLDKKFERGRDHLHSQNKIASEAVKNNNVTKMEKIFKAGGIEQEAIDYFIFCLKSVEMLKVFLRYGGDKHKLTSLLKRDILK
jgi:hypothetical protein